MDIEGLTHSVAVTSDDADYVSDVISRVFAPCIVRPLDHLLSQESSFIKYKDFTIGECKFFNGASFEPEIEANIAVCQIPIYGSSVINLNKESIVSNENTITFFNARSLKSSIYSSGRNEIVFCVSLDSLNSVAASYTGYKVKDISDFVINIKRDSLLGSAFYNYSNFINELIKLQHTITLSEITARRCKDIFIELALSSMGRQEFLGLYGRRHTIAQVQMKKADDFMFANRKKPIGISDVADHLGISVRSLQYSFKRYRDSGPLETLTRYRLEGFRGDLLTINGRSITEIAASWGFVHLGRLSLLYRRTFGETPRETVKQLSRSSII